MRAHNGVMIGILPFLPRLAHTEAALPLVTGRVTGCTGWGARPLHINKSPASVVRGVLTRPEGRTVQKIEQKLLQEVVIEFG